MQYIKYSDLGLENYARTRFEERILKPFKSEWNELMYYTRSYGLNAEDESDEEYYDRIVDNITIDNMNESYDIYFEDAEYNGFVNENRYLSLKQYDDFIEEDIIGKALSDYMLGDFNYALEVIRYDSELAYDSNLKNDLRDAIDSIVESYDFGIGNPGSRLYSNEFVGYLLSRQ